MTLNQRTSLCGFQKYPWPFLPLLWKHLRHRFGNKRMLHYPPRKRRLNFATRESRRYYERNHVSSAVEYLALTARDDASAVARVGHEPSAKPQLWSIPRIVLRHFSRHQGRTSQRYW